MARVSIKSVTGFLIVSLLATVPNTNLKAEFESFEKNEASTPVMHFQKGHAHYYGGNNRSSRVLMNYYGGSVLNTNSTMAIFWGNQWNSSTFAGDKIAGLDAFFAGYANSSYARTVTEYSSSAGKITTNSTYLGHVIDSTAVPAGALSVTAAIAEVCKITNNNPAANALYLIYTASGAGNVNYCAWHGWGSCGGRPVQVAYMPNLDGIAGCDPQDNLTGNSQGLAAVANVTGHELSETITDPRGNAWFDSSGNENGDKCAWSFPAGNTFSTFSNGARFKLQMEWSNAAYTTSTGQPNLSGQRGCIY